MFTTRNNYILEDDVYDFLTTFFIGHDVIREYKLNSSSRHKCDFYIPSKKLVVEFDGPRHFTSPDAVYFDIQKEKLITEKKLNLIRIPYFVQLDMRVIHTEFVKYHDDKSVTFNDFNDFPEGFITTKIFPAQFCEIGLKRFDSIMNHIMKNYDKMGERIYGSLFNQLQKKSITSVFNISSNIGMLNHFINQNPEYYGFSDSRAKVLQEELKDILQIYK
jgi:hypothetical protein